MFFCFPATEQCVYLANRDVINPENSLGISVRRNGSGETSNTRETTEKFSATFM